MAIVRNMPFVNDDFNYIVTVRRKFGVYNCQVSITAILI
jgi:hypothetical protein